MGSTCILKRTYDITTAFAVYKGTCALVEQGKMNWLDPYIKRLLPEEKGQVNSYASGFLGFAVSALAIQGVGKLVSYLWKDRQAPAVVPPDGQDGVPPQRFNAVGGDD